VLWSGRGNDEAALGRFHSAIDKGGAMAFTFPSDAWIKALSRRLNQSASYERSAKDWEGDFIFIVEPDEAYEETAYLFLGLYHGKSTDAALVESEDEREAAFVIRAPFSIWRRVIEGELDPIRGMMTRRLKLSGNMMKIMRYPRAAQEIVSCCAEVPTDWS
jgi:putative sterol carrier protein